MARSRRRYRKSTSTKYETPIRRTERGSGSRDSRGGRWCTGVRYVSCTTCPHGEAELPGLKNPHLKLPPREAILSPSLRNPQLWLLTIGYREGAANILFVQKST
ncbi:hypothetical protein HAX54_040880 [Datura stramonium]|uniref:Uncharacterized protein n=1 Tax=Datura stramonium TaxID=4076 RepID=A0ABS8SKT5_DATST|nr:hypothetical protein [Datura stramonium]